MDNSEKPETQGTQDEDKQSKNITQYVLDTTMHKQTQTQTRYEPSHKQMKAKTNRTSLYVHNQTSEIALLIDST